MKRTSHAMIYIALTSLLILLLLATAGIAYARLAGYSLPWWTADSGGVSSSSDDYQLNGTIAQPDAGTLSGGNYRLEGGFWGGGAKAFQHVYLPVVHK